MKVRRGGRMPGWAHLAWPEWNGRLLEHFFGRASGGDAPVSSLCVTPETLANGMGAELQDAEAVRNMFVDRTLSSRGRHEDILEAASDYWDFPRRRPPNGTPPPSTGVLLFTCLAASESDEELQSENSYLGRLNELARGHAKAVWHLPVLWRHLAEFLGDGSVRARYRQLILPDPGGLTRIGHTVKLSFPDRRDQKELSAVLHESGMAGAEPPIRSALGILLQQRGRFRRGFVDALLDFRRLYDSLGAGTVAWAELEKHRVWCAVRDAALRGRRGDGELQEVDDSFAVQLLADEADGRVLPFVVSTSSEHVPTSLNAFELPVPYGQWSHGIGADGQDEAAMQRAVSIVLANGGRFRLSQDSSIGLLVFSSAAHGLLELTTAESFADLSVALVKTSLVARLQILKPFAMCRTRRSNALDGWTDCTGVKPIRLPYDQLIGSPLERCWLFHDSVRAPRVRIAEGIRVDDGWLGFREALPVVHAEDCDIVAVTQGSDELRCIRDEEDGTWRLPSRDFEGRWGVLAQRTRDGTLTAEAIFHTSASEERFTGPTNPAMWLVEDTWATRRLSQQSPPRETPLELPSMQILPPCAVPGSATVATVRTIERVRSGVALRRRSMTEDEVRARADRIATVVVAASNRRAAVAYVDWSALVRRTFRLPVRDWRIVRNITRAWQEAGLIDVGYSTSWRAMAVFALRPQLAVVASEGRRRLTLRGLVLPSTREAVRSASPGALLSYPRSPFLPAEMTAYTDAERIASVSRTLRLPIVHPTGYDLNIALTGQNPLEPMPLGYGMFSESPHWSLLEEHRPDTIRVRRWFREDRPDVWTVERDGTSVWTYDRNCGALWACLLACRAALRTEGSNLAVAEHAYLPLALARSLISTGVADAGPELEEPKRYGYRFATESDRDSALRLYVEVFRSVAEPSYSLGRP